MKVASPKSRRSPSPVRTRVILFEEHTTVSELITHYLTTELRGSIDILGTARNLSEVSKLCKKNLPDIIIFEPLNSRILPLDIVENLLKISRKIKLLAFTRSRSQFLLLEMRRVGVRGVVTRDLPLSEFVKAVKAVVEGGFFFEEVSTRASKTTQVPSFTEREKQVISFVSLGYSTKAIAEHMGVTNKTINKFRQKAMDKVNAHDAVAITRFAIINGLSHI